MTHRSILAAAALISATFLPACQSVTPGQQVAITETEQTLALATQVAAPLVGNKQLSDDLYALGYVANAYGSQPVPTNILQATASLPGVAATVLPLVTGKSNGLKTTAIIDGAAAILAKLAAPSPAPSPSPSGS